MPTLLFLWTLIVHPGEAGAQRSPGEVGGRVVVEDDGPAIGAVVLLEGTSLGVSVDENGSFQIRNVPPGKYNVEARLVGYDQREGVSVVVEAGVPTSVRIIMRQSAVEFSPVEVSASRRQAADDTRASVNRMTPREAKYLPGAAEDVMRGLQALPGVTSVSDFSSQIVVRGSGPDQNLILIDGFEVLNPYRLYGVVSMFNPETVSEISLQTGGFGAQYGDRLSAVLEVKNREGRSDRFFRGRINTSLTNANIIAEGGLPPGGSYLLSARRTYYDLILGPFLRSSKLVKGDVALPNFRDLQAKATLTLDRFNKISFSAVTSRDGVEFVSGTERDRADSVNITDRSFNTLLGGMWQYTPSSAWLLETRLSWYKNDGTGAFDGTFVDPSQNNGGIARNDTVGLRFVNFAVDYGYVYKKISLTQRALFAAGMNSLEFGGGIDALQTDYIRYFRISRSLQDLIVSRGGVVPNDVTETVRYNRYNIYLQDRITLWERFFLQPGLRLDLFPSLQTQIYLAPRISASFGIDALTTVRAAFGVYYQSPGMEKQNFQTRLNFSLDAFSRLTPERATHVIVGIDRMVTPEWQFKAETYYKKFRGIIVPAKLVGTGWFAQRAGGDVHSLSGWTAPVRVTRDSLTSVPVNDATGQSYGFELVMQKIQAQPADRLTGWVSYALSWAERERGVLKTPFLFDQRHVVNVAGNYRLGESWDVGVSFTLRSGRPYQAARGIKPRIAEATVNGVRIPVMQTDQQGKVVLDVDYEQETLSGRLNLYHTLDVRLTTYPRWWGLSWSFYLDITNIYNRENEQFVNYYIDDDGLLVRRSTFGIPLFPALGMSVSF